MKNQEYRVFNHMLANRLISEGFNIIKIRKGSKEDCYFIYYFSYSKELSEAIQRLKPNK